MATHNQHLCPEGGGYQTEVYPTGQCVPNPTTQPERPSYLFSLSPPAVAGRLVDCTPHDNCTAASLLLPGKTQIPPSDTRPPDAESRQSVEGVYDVEGVETVETGRNAWLTVFPPSSNCSRPPVTTYKLRRGACTQLPVTGETYWTGGCRGWACQWFSQGCAAGCASCTGDAKVDHCPTATAPTLPDRFRTFGIGEATDWTRTHPWRSPGAAPVLDACGVAGGAPRDNSAPGGHPPPGHAWGARGSLLPPLASSAPASWRAGGVVEVGWGIAANHGGGYAYRLCPASAPLTEECFQANHLPFADAASTLRLGGGGEVRAPAADVSKGTVPAGGAWRRNPVPACRGGSCDAPQFPPPAGCDATCWGTSDNASIGRVLPVIVDRLKLPVSLGPGRYVLGFRWDCEATSQVWASCSDVTILSGGAGGVSAARQ
mmetsp:Transcript_39907/g.131998  ORF Transcript_39907/g.131998 Transcript_39907/m.131998 type:complete len:430 (+) Transcript_39907:172-1461(+)